jgi:hypothetical protein
MSDQKKGQAAPKQSSPQPKSAPRNPKDTAAPRNIRESKENKRREVK